jgi:hypothetical protein
MSGNIALCWDPTPVELRSYGGLRLWRLVERIANGSDHTALCEFHNYRPVFRLRDRADPMLFVEFLSGLQETLWVRRITCNDSVVMDMAYDLSLDKWSNIPNENETHMKSSGPDCRFYYGAVLNLVEGLLPEGAAINLAAEETMIPSVFQRVVVRQHMLSCLEARRSRNPAITRYGWEVGDGKRIYLWMPASMPGWQRRVWLEQHVGRVCPSQPGERYRIQTIVDKELGIVRVRSLGDGAESIASGRSSDSPVLDAIAREISRHGLPEVIANEKADSLDLLRPAIRALGKTCVKKLILQIFEGIGGGDYEEKRLAETYGLSRPTFSRFAGSRWKPGTASPIPDLWANVSKSLAKHEIFMEAAMGAGVWERVEQVLQDLGEGEGSHVD